MAEAQADVTVTRLGSRGGGSAVTLGDHTQELLGEIEEKTGLGYRGGISLVLCTDRESFDSYAASLPGGHGEVFGFFAPPEIIQGSGGVPSIALNLELIDESGARAREVYKHELAHAVLYANVLARLRPLWFEEGVAQWVSKTPMESVLRELGHAGGGGEDPASLNQVSMWMRQPESMGNAYAHGLAAVQLLESMHGEGAVRRLLVAMAAESSHGSSARIEEVYHTVFGASFGAFQQRFVEQRKRTDWGRWLGFLGTNLWALLMLFGGVLIAVGVHRKRRREAAMMESWRQIDADFPPEPDHAFHGPEYDVAEQAMQDHDALYGDDGDRDEEEEDVDNGDDDADSGTRDPGSAPAK
jgi:hypothetical protein